MLNEVAPFAWLEFDSATTTPVAENEYFANQVHTFSSHDSHAQKSSNGDKDASSAKALYSDLQNGKLTRGNKLRSQQFLVKQLQDVRDMESDLPGNMEEIAAWIEDNNERVGMQYRQYLDARKAGGGRRFFTTKAHALNFLRCVAPTKLVDGAWLYGFVRKFDDARVAALIRIYLEELGEGVPGKNHVALYKKLLASKQCDQWQDLPSQYFIQGAIQLALGHNSEEFLPEAIGFNLGYEQLPLHLLITAYELNELDIDPYYFTLHLTVDNASTGHARQSLQALMDSSPVAADKQEFFRRVANGYKLNQLGIGTNDIISSFDLDQEFIDILAAKSVYGKNMHSDYCRIGGRTVNDWLSDKSQIPEFIDRLVDMEWIVRHQDPQHSRFWKLLQSDKAEMFGVFSAYEMQVIHDWIAGDALVDGLKQHESERKGAEDSAVFPPRENTFRRNQRRVSLERKNQRSISSLPENKIGEQRLLCRTNDDQYQVFDLDMQKLQETIGCMQREDEVMQMLASFMSPAMHHTPVGLLATRLYVSMLNNGN